MDNKDNLFWKTGRSEYWKSLQKKYCEFCKCWFPDSKTGNYFHEKGKKHQEKVKKNRDELKKKRLADKKKKDKENDYMQQMEKGDEKPNETEHINLKVTGQDGSVVHFKIKRNTPLRKLMSAYCDRAGLKLGAVRFRFDGNPINETDTPSGLDMEDSYLIDVFLEQTGGFAL